MNRPQSWVVSIGLLATAALLLFPPWKTVFVGGWYSPGEWSEGFRFLLIPPLPSSNAYQYHSTLYVRIDGLRLFSLLAVNSGMFLGIFWVFRSRDGVEAEPLGVFLRKRRLTTAILLSLGTPLPPIGPVAFAVPSIALEGGHVWLSALLFEATSFLCLAVLFYLTLALLPKLSPKIATFVVQDAED